jgi:hypothetical protein
MIAATITTALNVSRLDGQPLSLQLRVYAFNQFNSSRLDPYVPRRGRNRRLGAIPLQVRRRKSDPRLAELSIQLAADERRRVLCRRDGAIRRGVQEGGSLTVLYPLYATTFIWAAIIALSAHGVPIKTINVVGMLLLIAGMYLMGK